ncbi:MAG: fluoride efflux transporter CrcB [Desulfuromonas sp.]|nr:fluoride efflux transporter CrcB [Desulfuromonas sp.]
MQSLYVGLFGALGCLARYFSSSWIHSFAAGPLPFGTLAVNVIGSLLIGLLMGGDLHHPLLGGNLRIGLAVGFLGGFTTFSTFSYETVRLMESGSVGAAFFNVLLNVVLCLLAAWLGIVLARQM